MISLELGCSNFLLFCYGFYFLLLTLGYLLVASPEIDIRVGMAVESFSLIFPAITTAVYFPSFRDLIETLSKDTVFRLLLTLLVFVVLLLVLPREGGFGVLVSLATATVGSVFIFLLAASGGLALSYVMLHAIVVAGIHTRAVKARLRRKEGLYGEGIKCLEVLLEMSEAHLGRSSEAVAEQIKHCAEILRRTRDVSLLKITEEMLFQYQKLRRDVVRWELVAKVRSWRSEIESLVSGVAE